MTARRARLRAGWAMLGITVGVSLAVFPLGTLRADSAHPAPAQPPGSTQPKGSVMAEVMILHATNQPDGGTGIDPQIGALPALGQPPFSSYNTYQLISRNRYPLAKSTPVTSPLPNDRVLQISMREILGGSGGDRTSSAATRYRVTTSINQPGGTTFLPLLEVTTPASEPFFVAGQSYRGGMLVIGITIVP